MTQNVDKTPKLSRHYLMTKKNTNVYKIPVLINVNEGNSPSLGICLEHPLCLVYSCNALKKDSAK